MPGTLATDLRAAILIKIATGQVGTIPERLRRPVVARRSAATKISNEATVFAHKGLRPSRASKVLPGGKALISHSAPSLRGIAYADAG